MTSIKTLTLSTLWLSLATPLALADSTGWVQQVPGAYSGQVSGGNYSAPIITEFILTTDGDLFGSYAILENAGTAEADLALGVLTNCQANVDYQLSCTWHDRYGSGTLNLGFTEDLATFDGQWNADGETVIFPWTGER